MSEEQTNPNADLEAMGRDELKAEGLKFGVAFDSKMSTDQMRKKLDELRAAAEYLRKEEQAAAEDIPEEAEPKRARKVRIKIHDSDGFDGKHPVKVGLNGRAYVIKRNQPVDIPEDVFRACIEGSRFTVYEPQQNPVNGQTEILERNVDRFAYTLYGYADELGAIPEQQEAPKPFDIRQNAR